jgi:EAL and modified HD-GYP domain-containing signal transduction protein
VTGKPDDLFHTGLLRGHFCQSLAGDRAATAFTVGILSILDQLLDRPAAELLADLPLAVDIRQAIVEHAGELGEALACVQAIERQDWPALRESPWPPRTLGKLYSEASQAAYDALASLDVESEGPR